MCVEEPENQLYPNLLTELLEEFRIYGNTGGGQVFITSHSPDLLNAAEPAEVFWLTKKDGYTQVHAAGDDAMIQAQYAEGNPLGYLWKTRMFTGSAPIYTYN